MITNTTVIGLDVGGTKMLLETFDKNGKVQVKIEEKTITTKDHLTFFLCDTKYFL